MKIKKQNYVIFPTKDQNLKVTLRIDVRIFKKKKRKRKK